MTKPRTRTAVINAVLRVDKRAHVQVRGSKIVAQLFSANAFVELQDDIDLPIISKSVEHPNRPGMYKGMIVWDCSSISDGDSGQVKPYAFNDSKAGKVHEEVVEQEEEAAELVGGHRHPGSGAIDGLKSDGSGRRFQIEAKGVRGASFSMTLEVLDKIYREARSTSKIPMLHVRFKSVPSSMTVPEDWVAIPASVFKEMVRICGWR